MITFTIEHLQMGKKNANKNMGKYKDINRRVNPNDRDVENYAQTH